MHSKNQKRHSSPVPSRSPVLPMKPKAPAVTSAVAPSPGDSPAFRVPKDYPHSRFSKAPLAVYPPKGTRNKTCVSLPIVSLEKMPCLNRADTTSHVRLNSSSSSSSSSSSTLSPLKSSSLASQRSGEKLTNGRGGSGGPSTPRSVTPPSSSLDRRPSPARSPLNRRAPSTASPSPMDKKPSLSPSHRSVALPSMPSLSPLEKKPQNGTKTPARPHKRASGRVFDPDKHCGVPDPETKRSCTRSLTCKTHSLTQRRAVPGRSRPFDVLLAEHKGLAKEREALKEREKEAAQRGKEASGQSVAPQDSASPSKSHCPGERPLSSLKLRLANAHIPRVPGGSSASSSSSLSASSPLPPAAPPAAAPAPEPSPSGWANAAGDGGRLSSDEGDAETPDDADRPSLHYSTHHPRPSGFCVFSSRLVGPGCYVFDRRWDRMRLALQSMVEKHLNAQMWRKVPLAAESLPSNSTSVAASVTAHQAPPAAVLSSPSSSLTYTASFPQSASAAGLFSVRDSPGKARNGSHKAGRSPKDSDAPAAAKKRKNSSCPPSSFPPSPFQTVDVHRRNGSSFHQTFQGFGVARASPAKNKGLRAGSGLLSGSDCPELRLSRAEQSHNTYNCRELGTSSLTYAAREPSSAPHQPMPPPTGPLAYSGGAEGRKRRSPSSYKGKSSKASRPAGLESLFGKGNDGAGILASGPESPRQAKLNR